MDKYVHIILSEIENFLCRCADINKLTLIAHAGLCKNKNKMSALYRCPVKCTESRRTHFSYGM